MLLKWYTRKYLFNTKESNDEGRECQNILYIYIFFILYIYGLWKTNSKITDINLTLSVIILNINRLNHPIKKQILAEWIKKNYKKDTLHLKTQIA